MWSDELVDRIVLLQGTGQTYDPERGERCLQMWSTEFHDIIEARARRKLRGHVPTGVAVMVPRGMAKIMKKVLLPGDPELGGRGLLIWFARGQFELCVATLYCPLGDRDVGNQKRCEKLWNWLSRARELVPRRTTTVIGADANGHVGSVRRVTSVVAAMEAEDAGWERAAEDYPHVGPWGAEEENYNGQLMREFLEQNELMALNTWAERASGKTWRGGRGAATRVDYIMTEVGQMRPGDKVELLHDMHRILRCLAGLEVNDHTPLQWTFRYIKWERLPLRQAQYDAEQMVRSCVVWDRRATTYADRVRHFFETEFTHKEAERAADPREPMDKIAEMLWKL